MINRQNYLLVQEFLKLEKFVKNLSDGSIQVYSSRLNHVLKWLDDLALEKCLDNHESIYAYLDKVTVGSNPDKPGKKLSLATQKKVINIFKRLLRWAKKKYPKKFAKLDADIIESFKPPRISEISAPIQPYITIEEMNLIAEADFKDDLVLRAVQAAACLLFLGAQRRTAFVTTPIKAVDVDTLCIHQTREMGVVTKNNVSRTTSMLNIEGIIDRVREWDQFVRSQLPPDAMWYPPIKNTFGAKTLTADPPGKHRGSALAKNLRKLCNALDIEYKPPHAYRRGHTIYAYQFAETMSDLKAISYNLMHTTMITTDKKYSRQSKDEIHSTIISLTQKTPHADNSSTDDLESMLTQLLQVLHDRKSD